jgi:hypothetical protein
MDDKIEKIIEKIMDADEAAITSESFDKNTARVTGKPFRGDMDQKEKEKEPSYDEWLKKQPKSNVIGIHKNKKMPIKK